ncbi:unnamed protein product [Citrullus colocynthis]|uniref:Alpha/beta hydrolase fold-3 domain-containing protein n=1 Tax=Citrullus colocynthis TaxID=252529 RepID=A0ABP0Z9M6_9ROSI
MAAASSVSQSQFTMHLPESSPIFPLPTTMRRSHTMSKFNPYEHLSVSLNPDGSLSRLLHLPAISSAAPGEPVAFKDITLKASTATWFRLFRPTNIPANDGVAARLPIVIYFHHGGWILHTASDAITHRNCADLAAQIPAIAISVNYRLAPESRLPAQYDDAVDALRWVKTQMTDPDGEKWLKDFGDFSRCYLYGVGCGGNIAFFAGLKAAAGLKLEPMKVAGIVMNQPMFGGVQRTKSELQFATDQLLPLPVLDLMWELALPKGMDQDHRYCNPMVGGPHKELIGRLGRCLVIGFGGDPMVDRQQEFVKMLTGCGAQVMAWFDDMGFHNVDLVDHRRAAAVMSLVKEFII